MKKETFLKNNILIIGNPHDNESVKSFLEKIVIILLPISKQIYIIAGNNVTNYKQKVQSEIVNYELSKNILYKLKNFINIQIKILKYIKKNKNYKISIILPQLFIIPTLWLKINNKKIVIYFGGRASISCRSKKQKIILNLFELFNLILADKIIVESYNAINFLKLGSFIDKIVICHQSINIDEFYIKNQIVTRENIIGYIGRLDKEKGFLEFIQSIPLILENSKKKLKFLIVGGGECQKEMFQFIEYNKSISRYIEIRDWIPNKYLPEIYNKLKIFVLPSFSEGLPNTILEAMACGTIVLSTPVGAIPDIIIDEKTGFIMENNSPKCIANNVIRILNHPKLEIITYNSRQFIEKNYNFEITRINWDKLISEL